MIIDADTHILEGEHTWDFLQPHEERFRPEMAARWWIVDGATRRRGFDDPRVPQGVRDLTDPKARVEKMDEFGVDVQVIYPSLQLAPTTEQPEGLLALCRSYNRFMAEACSSSNGRLRWVLIPPVDTMPEALAEIEFGKLHGACGILLRGVEGTRVLSNHYFDPLYARAATLNMPICIHTGIANRYIWDVLFTDNFGVPQFPVLGAFRNLLLNSVPDRFPSLRFGFIEAGAQWVPYMVGEVMRNGAFKRADRPAVAGLPGDEKLLVAQKRMFIACRIQDDLNYILQWTGKANLVTGTDYGHNDAATEFNAFRDLRDRGEVDDETIDGIVGANAKALYAIESPR